jgi:hypothetical protein
MRFLWILLTVVCLVACGSPSTEDAQTPEPEDAAAASAGEEADDEGEAGELEVDPLSGEVKSSGPE